MTSLAVDQGEPTRLFAATETAGAFRSSDGGASWQAARTGLPVGQDVSRLAAGGADGRTVAAIVDPPVFEADQQELLFVSTDGGDRWIERQLPQPAGPNGNPLGVVAVSPDSSATIYVVYQADTGSVLFASRDGGLSWASLQVQAPHQAEFISDFVVAPSDPDVLYVAAFPDGILRSDDAGAHWTRVGNPFAGGVKLAVDPRDSNHLYAADWGLFTSSVDGGHTWSRGRWISTLIQGNDQFVGMAVDPVHRGTIYFAVAHFVAERIFDSWDAEFRYEGLLFRSVDDGLNWTLEPVTEVFYALAAVMSPADISKTRLYAGASRDGVLSSDDGGRSWQSAAVGLKAGINCSLSADPFVPQLLYISTGFCRDENGDTGFWRGIPGKSWTQVNRNLRERTRVLDAFGIVPDPRSPGTLYALTGQGLFRSEDRGANWHPLRRLASDQEGIISLAIDPLDRRRLYALGFAIEQGCGGGCGPRYFVRRSNDAGEIWTDILPATDFQLTTVVVDPESPATLYVTGSFLLGAGIIKSTDGGESWKALPMFDALTVTQLAIHPEDSHLLFASLYSFNPYDSPKVMKSGDGGETWAVADAGLPNFGNVWSIAVDPTRLSTVYAGTDFGFFVSDDGGTNWRLLSNGLGAGTVSQVLVDPFDPLTVYAGTPADGGLFALTRSAPP